MVITITRVKDRYGWLSCMSPHPVYHNGAQYRTCEALFQCLRFQEYPEIQEEIKACLSPMGAKMIARREREKLGRGIFWDQAEDDIDRMKLCLRLKFEQHPELQRQLIETGETEIIEDCTTHDRESARFWGAVKVGNRWIGANRLGKLLMEIREEMQNSNDGKEIIVNRRNKST
jgi:N-glycosidase YbiA